LPVKRVDFLISRIVVQVIYGPAKMAQPFSRSRSSHILHFEVLAKLIGAKEKMAKEMEPELGFEVERWRDGYGRGGAEL